MKMERRYEASDIDFEHDKTHQFLAACGTAALLVVTTRPASQSPEDARAIRNEMVALMLNVAEDMGIRIVSGAGVPAIYREAFEGQ